MFPSIFNERRHSATSTKKAPFFIRRWNTLQSLKIHVDRDLIIEEAWHEFIPDSNAHAGPEELQIMVRSFLVAIPSVQSLVGKIPKMLMDITISRHVDIMMTHLVGDQDQRMDLRFSFNDFKAVFLCIFIVADVGRERSHVDIDSTLHGLEELDKSLEVGYLNKIKNAPFSEIIVAVFRPFGNWTALKDATGCKM
jgi:hypothetical protein